MSCSIGRMLKRNSHFSNPTISNWINFKYDATTYQVAQNLKKKEWNQNILKPKDKVLMNLGCKGCSLSTSLIWKGRRVEPNDPLK